MKGRILVTGFEPFDGHAVNVSWSVAQALDGRGIVDTHWLAACLPCRFGDSIKRLAELIEQHDPPVILSLGQAEGRPDITVERVAINLRDARIADNGGRQPVDEPVIADGPYAYPSGLPVRELVATLRSHGHALSVSNSAGTFVCNDLFYGLMHITRSRSRSVSAGFIHLPITPEQRRAEHHRSAARDDAPRKASSELTPALPLDDQIAAIEAAGHFVLRHHRAHR